MKNIKWEKAVTNFILRNGAFWNLELGNEDKEKVAEYMEDKLRQYKNGLDNGKNFMEAFDFDFGVKCTDTTFTMCMGLLLNYGSNWDKMDISIVEKEIEEYANSQNIKIVINKDKKESEETEQYTFMLTKALMHVIYRNGIIEDMHSENDVLSDKVMKELNKDIMNRLGFIVVNVLIKHNANVMKVIYKMCEV